MDVLILLVGIATLACVVAGIWLGLSWAHVEVIPAADGLEITVTNRGGRACVMVEVLLIYGLDPENTDERRGLYGEQRDLAGFQLVRRDPLVRPDTWSKAFDGAQLRAHTNRSDRPTYLRVRLRDASPATVRLTPQASAIVETANHAGAL